MSLIVLWVLLGQNRLAVAAPNIDSLVPNTYEEMQFRDNKELLRKESNRQTQQLSEEKKLLTFEQRSINQNERWIDLLFSNASEPRKTISVQAEQYNLFTQEESMIVSSQANSMEPHERSSSLRMLYRVILAAAILVIFIILVPKIAQGSNKDQSSAKAKN